MPVLFYNPDDICFESEDNVVFKLSYFLNEISFHILVSQDDE